ncbi:tetraacyldisaccharide 4'-kinase [Acinetobacter baumannii]|uniref:tetraacyldisaccharide 4'-kinase n=1 Tax=Acinetobacter baumannii TaxID=470 RepID=UPI000447A37F|nr:tetraacyldisaccharide 4'-kinase [Acinetobacter baumannii]EXA60559.1 tetraacyldisaccharide 4'-kinase [Acinetobacter baumannii 1035119]MDC5041475.1 tetraacyldisaccharide 4'-kinase [Acinetobacter baumannii]CAA0274748.1 tetraacyldisaccharide 4'-kinase [Acinetobacter baumannii]
MSLAQLIPNAWNKQSSWLIVLRPLSCLYRAGFLLNRYLYSSGFKKVYTAPVPVMVIGNITVGGSGKTPLLIELVNYLKQHNVKVGVISRGYGGAGPFPMLVTSASQAAEAGDEPALIVQSTGVPMAVGPNRQVAIELLLASTKLDLIISDDGLQHWALGRQIEWIVLDQNRGLGNRKLLPEGYLREPVERLKTSTVIEHTFTPTTTLHMHLDAGQPYLLNPSSATELSFNIQNNYHAVVGIGFPQRFYQTLKGLGVKQFQEHAFRDHHDYSIDDLLFNDDQPIITTEKDAVKLLPLLEKHPEFKRPIWVVPVKAVLSTECYQVLNQQLQKLDIQIS